MTGTIFITGGASGIGRAIAQRFAAEGWFVALADVDAAGMAQTGALLPAGRWSAHRLDVRDAAGWDAALAEAAQAGGGAIHVVANNAGVPLGGPLAQCSVAEIEQVIAINLTGATLGARAAYPWLQAAAAKGGAPACLLNTASAAALYGTPGTSVYAATKAGLRALTEALDAEWARDGIAVRSLMPGFIATPLIEQAPNAATPGTIRDVVTRQRLEIGRAEDVAQAAWQAVHGQRLHTLVGPTARRLAFAARWLPGALRRRLQR
ncbi:MULTISPECIES: SDR family oxidoreductase [unclassified Sphingomonas]|uniref:SDR family oxidoreductase n=1 Tax=Novosphingobium rhizosphaerae TaxID=1551649 RepID=UPI0015CC05E6